MPTLRQQNKSIYWAWKAMKQRCLNQKCHAYYNYGARGITVCDEWMEFEPFCEWALSSGYVQGLDLDRADNDGNYTPDNCRWVSRRENINNRRKTVYLTVNGVTRPRSEWEHLAHIPSSVSKSWYLIHGKEYAEERIADALKNGYTEKDYGYSHRKRVMHIESGLIFDSVRDAAKYFGIAPCSISNSIRDKRTMRVGTFTYELLD